MTKITLGLVAHVDAGKTTCSESLLYTAGSISSMGRVDHQDSFLDYDGQERKRGITIYLKQARMHHGSCDYVLLDTPGHLDFSSEMERTLQVLDYALLILSSRELIQSHTRTIWKLLQQYQIPVIIFVNKMDLAQASKEDLLKQLQTQLSPNCCDLSASLEEIALNEDSLLEEYEQTGTLSTEHIALQIYERHLFPVCFGSALKDEGIAELLSILDTYTMEMDYPETLGGRVFKITRDPQGNRLTHLKLTGGKIRAKDCLEGEKIDQIRLYNGTTFTMVNEATAGEIVSLKGIHGLQAGDGFGYAHSHAPLLNACLRYRIQLPSGTDAFAFLKDLKQLEEEDPTLHFAVLEQDGCIYANLMGEIQIEILKQVIQERFQTEVEFTQGTITYQETVASVSEGVGHFEPLRHYAEVHLLISPGEKGSGITIETDCPVDVLKPQWQNQILSALDEATLTGVLTNSKLTDVKITLINGKGHIKHTEGGDFKEAALRAVRHGLLKNQNVLCEPYGTFELRIPSGSLSRAVFDLQQRNASFELFEEDSMTSIRGSGPIRTLQNYAMDMQSYARGQGSFALVFDRYEPSVDQAKLVAECGYDPLNDTIHPASSVFCEHGSSTIVPYELVEEWMHLPLRDLTASSSQESYRHVASKVSEGELSAIMNRLYPKRPKVVENSNPVKPLSNAHVEIQASKVKEKLLLVDGYNMIFGWQDLKTLATQDLATAREHLLDALNEYSFHFHGRILVVFDAYLVKESSGSNATNGAIELIYTKHGQTADSYIEASIRELVKTYTVTVATSDQLEQISVYVQGASRISARELEQLVHGARTTSMKESPYTTHHGNYPLRSLKDTFHSED